MGNQPVLSAAILVSEELTILIDLLESQVPFIKQCYLPKALGQGDNQTDPIPGYDVTWLRKMVPVAVFPGQVLTRV